MSPATINNAVRLLHHAQWTLRDLQSKCASMTLQTPTARALFREDDERYIAQRLRELEGELMQLEASMTEGQP